MKTNDGRILGIDYGSKRVGLAISDPLRILATSFATIENDRELIAKLKDIVRTEEVLAVVVGMPTGLSGRQTQKGQEVSTFIERLKAGLRCEVLQWDERFTSSMARQTLLTMGTKRKERRENKGRIDSMAAAIMLQSFLDSTKRSLSC